MGRNFGALLSIILSCFSSAAVAYPTPVDFDGSVLRWPISRGDAPILYQVVSDTGADIAGYEQTVIEAALMWSDVRTSYFSFAQAGEGETAQVTIHLEPTLKDAPFSAGYAVFDKYSAKGEPEHCDVFIGLSAHSSYLSLAKTALHELGHCVGLGHSLVPEAIMGYQLEKNNFELDVDDQAAITRLYPADGSNPKLPAGCATGTYTTNRPTAWFLLLFSPFLILCYNGYANPLRPRLQNSRDGSLRS